MPRELRADAERNRRRLLDVAQDAFASEGLAVSVEEIARRAGVGIGTLYRHFPTKQTLVQAIVIDRMERVAERATALAGRADAGPAFLELVEHLVAEGVRKRDLVDALGADFEHHSRETKQRFRQALATLLERAQEAGAIRRDVDAADIVSLVRGIFAASHDDASRARHLAIICAGLEPPRSSRPPSSATARRPRRSPNASRRPRRVR